MGDNSDMLNDLSEFIKKISIIFVPLIGIWLWDLPFELEMIVITKLITTIGYIFIVMLFYIDYKNKELYKKVTKLAAIEKEVEV